MLKVVDPESPIENDAEFWVLITGNPVDGLNFYGPFGMHEWAIDFADRHISHTIDWWVAELKDTRSLVGQD